MAEILDEVNQHRMSTTLSEITLANVGKRLSTALEQRRSATPAHFTKLPENKDATGDNDDDTAMREMGYEQELN